MIATGPWLEARATQLVLRLLTDAGHQALTVGGCVRNHLLGMPVADVDIATDARPEVVIQLASEAGIKSVPTGIDHGTVTLVVDGAGYEVTTFRRDVATDGRRATVRYSDTIEEDAKRRDFTMNALYVQADGRVVDPLGGLPDIRARRLRFIGDPVHRIREDYLRILRFFRFQAWYGDADTGPDRAALLACEGERGGISRLSDERTGSEVRKLLAAPDPAPSVRAMAAIGVLEIVLPEASASGLKALVALEAAEKIAPSWQRRLLALGGDEQARRMCLSKSESRHLKAIREALACDAPAAECAYRFGAGAALDAALIAAARDGRDTLPAPLRGDISTGAKAEFPVSAGDLLPEIPQGPALGAKLDALRDRWIASGFALSRDDLLRG